MRLPSALRFWALPGDRSQFTLFSRRRLLQLLVPLLVEQVVVVAVSFIDTLMLSSIHQDALAAISLVDMVNLLILQLFVAVGAGCSIIAAQYLGKRERENAIDTANQGIILLLMFSSLVCLLTLLLGGRLLRLIYPRVSPNTMAFAREYLTLSALSYPAYALYYGGASLLYAQSNSRSSMVAALAMNLVKVGLNLLLIKVFRLGVMGIGLATLASRLTGAFIVTRILLDRTALIHYRRPIRLKLVLKVDRRIFKVAAPTGMENFIFNFGKLIIGTIFARFASAMLAANAASAMLSSLVNVPANAMSLAMVTVVGQCVGSGNYAEAEYNTKRLLYWRYASLLLLSLPMLALLRPLVRALGLTPEAAEISLRLLRLYIILNLFSEPLTFGLPNALRASGDNTHTMYVCLASMIVLRVGASYLLVYGFGLQMDGIWYAMYLDWLLRAVLFTRRFQGGKWKKHSLV